MRENCAFLPIVRPLTVVFVYSHKDERLRDELDKQLAPLKRSGQILTWHDRKLLPGSRFDEEIAHQLVTCDIVLLLISPDFVDSDYCYRREMQIAIDRHRAGQARVIPIILVPVDWQGTPFAGLNALPKDGKPVVRWHPRAQGFCDAAQGIRRVVEEMIRRSIS